MRTLQDTRRTTALRTLASVVAGGCICAALTACGGDAEGEDGPELMSGRIDSDQRSSAAGAAAPGADLPDPEARPTGEAVPPENSQPKDVLPSDGAELSVTEVRAGTHDGFDRVVVELDGTGSPGWKVTEDESGAGLEIEMRGLASSDSDEKPRVNNAANTVVESVDVSDMDDGSRKIKVGLEDASADYTVSLLSKPTRLVVDIMHP
ncbi:MAG TPA: hypothetical protein H9870_07045 [Candidatus Corynebacterium avicola]|uniref:AMIN-like domain-containing protein n=1 Tax=Candidatus Corynebacterium avicola TaxID=2838527 RepID=A0A9D1RNV2_9CORY|nr:hypothetical protein [Candidatus Corynebacterium avicola]